MQVDNLESDFLPLWPVRPRFKKNWITFHIQEFHNCAPHTNYHVLTLKTYCLQRNEQNSIKYFCVVEYMCIG